jgi:hypothetical protein
VNWPACPFVRLPAHRAGRSTGRAHVNRGMRDLTDHATGVRSDMDDAFYLPNRPSPLPRQPKAGERLFEFLRGHDRFLCELRDHGATVSRRRLERRGVLTRHSRALADQCAFILSSVVWTGMPHGFVASIGTLKASAQALDAIGLFLTERLQAGIRQ